MSYKLEMIQDMLDKQLNLKIITIEKILKEYIEKNNLTIEDIKKHGVVNYFPDGKTIYKYKDKIICEITSEKLNTEDIYNHA